MTTQQIGKPASKTATDAVDALIRAHNRKLHREEVARAKADPAKHAKTTAWPVGCSPRYRVCDAGKNAAGETVLYAYSTNRNAAGFFLSWRETHGERVGVRDEHVAHRKRKAAKARAGRDADRALEAQGKPKRWEFCYSDQD